MAVQLIIDGQHIIDVLAQVQQLAQATSGDVPATTTAPAKSAAAAPTKAETPTPAKTETAAAPAKAAEKTLSREEQDAAVKEMIEAGFKDPRFYNLTKGRQKAVEDGLAKAKETEEAADEGDDLDDMFGDSEEAAPVEVTGEMVRQKMGELGKDADGNAIQANLVKIRDILTKYIPKGEEIKVGKIPQAKLAAAYAELLKMEA